MLLIFFIINIFFIFLGVYLYNNSYKYKNIGILTSTIASVFATILFIAIFICVINLIDRSIINQKIELYQTENTEIEQQIATSIDNYQQYEQSTYEKCKPDDAIMIVNAYPELKSDKLIQQQINIYIYNNSVIKKLKSTALYYPIYAWCLYFGS